LQRLRGLKEIFRNEIGVDVVGFRPPEEAYDYFTIQALAAAGYDYMFADDRSDRGEPKIVRVFPQSAERGRTGRNRENTDHVELVQFPMLNLDDIKLIMIPGKTDVREIFENYTKDIELIVSREGLYMANLHTHVLANPNNLPVLRSVVQYLDGMNIWIPKVVDAANWWKLKSGVSVSLSDIRTNSAAEKSKHNRQYRKHNTRLSP